MLKPSCDDELGNNSLLIWIIIRILQAVVTWKKRGRKSVLLEDIIKDVDRCSRTNSIGLCSVYWYRKYLWDTCIFASYELVVLLCVIHIHKPFQDPFCPLLAVHTKPIYAESEPHYIHATTHPTHPLIKVGSNLTYPYYRAGKIKS